MIEECRHWAWRRLLCLRNLNKDNSRILDEFIAVTGHHRKHGIRLLGKPDDDEGTAHSVLERVDKLVGSAHWVNQPSV